MSKFEFPVLPKDGLFTEPILIPLNPTVFRLVAGNQIGMNTGVYGSGFGPLSFQFASSDTSIVTVPQEPLTMDTGIDMYSDSYTLSAMITAVGPGKATITVTMNGQSRAAELEVFGEHAGQMVTVNYIQPGIETGSVANGFVNVSELSKPIEVQLFSSDTAVVGVPASLAFSQKITSLSADYDLQCGAEGNALVTATLHDSSTMSAIQVVGTSFSLLSVSPLTLNLAAGQTGPVTATFSKPAPADGVLHNWYDPGGGFSAPVEVPIPQGAQSVTFDVTGISSQSNYGLNCSYSRQTLVVLVNVS